MSDGDVYTTGEYFHRITAPAAVEGQDIFEVPAARAKSQAMLDLTKMAGLAQENLHVVELGCGHGVALFPFEQMCTARIEGLDVSEVAIRAAAEHAKSVGSNIQFRCGSAESVPSDTTWLLLFDVIEHVSDPYQFLKEIRGKAEYYLIHTPIEQSIGHLLLDRPKRSYDQDTHLHYWSWLTFQIMLQECGYRIARYRFDAGRYATWKQGRAERLGAWMHRLLPRQAPLLVGGSACVLAVAD